MEQYTGWLPGSTSNSCRSSVTCDYSWLSDKLYVNKVLTTYVDQPSLLHSEFDIHNSIDVQNGAASAELPSETDDRMDSQVMLRNERRRGSDSGCSLSSPLVDDIQLSALTDTVSTDAESAGVTVAAEVVVDYPGELTTIEPEKQSSVYHAGDKDFGGEVQPLGDSSVCSVCGDIAAGFHCGAYVCEACKVRTLLSLKLLSYSRIEMLILLGRLVDSSESIRSTPVSRPNKVGLKFPSARSYICSYVRTSVHKKFLRFNFNVILKLAVTRSRPSVPYGVNLFIL